MTDEKPEEETYSLIYASLKHPIRRKIIRMLADKPLTFSEILEAVGIDSGHLNYHLDNLGYLITHSQEGRYQLSTVGSAAAKLMRGVEEQSNELARPKLKLTRIFAKAYPLILCGALIIASLYFISYTTTVTKVANEVGWLEVFPPSNVTVSNLTTGINQNATNWMTSINETSIVLSPVNVTSLCAPGNVTWSAMTLTLQATPINVTTSWKQSDNPYLYYGIAGLVIALVYPVVVSIDFLRNMRRKPKP